MKYTEEDFAMLDKFLRSKPTCKFVVKAKRTGDVIYRCDGSLKLFHYPETKQFHLKCEKCHHYPESTRVSVKPAGRRAVSIIQKYFPAIVLNKEERWLQYEQGPRQVSLLVSNYYSEERQRFIMHRETTYDFYKSYLQTPRWQKKRMLVIARDNGVCQSCLVKPATQAHHLTYDRLYNEPLFDLIAVCKECHESIHGGDGVKAIYHHHFNCFKSPPVTCGKIHPGLAESAIWSIASREQCSPRQAEDKAVEQLMETQCVDRMTARKAIRQAVMTFESVQLKISG